MLKISTIAGASVAAVAVGVGLVSGATAATAQPGGNHQNQNQNRQGDRVTDQREMRGKVPFTDVQRTSASEAAVTAVPGGTVLEVRADRDGGFRVLVRTSEGMKKMVTVDSSYAVTSVKDAKQGHGRGKGPHGKGTDVTGEAYTKAEAAALTAVPGGTVVDVHQRGTVYHVLVKKADGTKVCVTLDATFQVTDTASFRLQTAA